MTLRKKPDLELVNDIASTYSIFLCDLMNYLETQRAKSHTFDPKLFKGLGVILKTFNSNDLSLCKDPHEHTFFSPMELDELKKFKRDLRLQETKNPVKEYLGDWYIPKQTENPWTSEVSIDNAEELCQAIDVAFSDIPYEKEHKTWDCLSDLKTWKKMYVYSAPGVLGFLNADLIAVTTLKHSKHPASMVTHVG